MALSNSLPQQFVDAWNRHDMTALAELFAHDARFVNVVEMFWRSRQEVYLAHEAAHRTIFRDSVLEIAGVEEVQLADGIVAPHGAWTLHGQKEPDGSTDNARSGILLLVSRRDQSGEWLIAVAHNTDVLEGAVTQPAKPSTA